MIRSIIGLVPERQPLNFFYKTNVVQRNLIKSITDTIIIKNKPASLDAGLFLVSESFKKQLLSTNLDKIKILTEPKKS